MQGRDKLRLESVQAATCGAENARESEDYFGRFFYGGAGSSFCNRSTAKRSTARMQAQSGLSRWLAISYLRARQDLPGKDVKRGLKVWDRGKEKQSVAR